jgi:hypothetical protein
MGEVSHFFPSFTAPSGIVILHQAPQNSIYKDTNDELELTQKQ